MVYKVDTMKKFHIIKTKGSSKTAKMKKIMDMKNP